MDGKVPTDAKARKAIPLFSGCIAYFPDALLAVAELSRIGNDQHNPGKPLHWDRTKSSDEADALLRHQVDVGKLDTDGVRHATKVAWRALAQLQKEIEASLVYRPTVRLPEPVKPAWWDELACAAPGLRFATTKEIGMFGYDDRTGRDNQGDVWVTVDGGDEICIPEHAGEDELGWARQVLCR